jgi:hypothetical protein
MASYRRKYNKDLDGILSGIQQSGDLNVLQVSQYSQILSERRVSSESLLPAVDPVSGRHPLTPGRWIFDSGTGGPVVLQAGLDFDFQGQSRATIEVRGTILYLGTEGRFIDSVMGNGNILRFTNCVFLGGSLGPAHTGFVIAHDLIGQPPVLIMDFVQFTFWNSIGLLTDFDTVILANYSDRLNGGYLTIADVVNTFNVTTADIQQALVGNKAHFTMTGTTSPLMTISNIAFTPDDSLVGESCFSIANTLTPFASFIGGAFRTTPSSTAEWFDPAGQDKTSVYVKVTGIRNVPDSLIAYREYFVNFTTPFALSIDYVNVYKTPVIPRVNFVQDVVERLSVNVATSPDHVYWEITGQDKVTENIELFASAKMNNGGEKQAGIAIFRGSAATAITATTDSVTDTFTCQGFQPALLNNAPMMLFGINPDTTPSLAGSQTVYATNVVLGPPVSFTIALVPGGATIQLLTTGQSVDFFWGSQVGPSAAVELISSSYRPVSTSSVVEVSYQDVFWYGVRNTSDVVGIDIGSVQFSIS